ncbi:uncharacterized protein LOC102805674 [Saccoglossus kowalevskii]
MYSRQVVIALLVTVVICIQSTNAVNICKTKAGLRMKSCRGRPGKRTDKTTVSNAVFALLRAATEIIEDMSADEINSLLEDMSDSSDEDDKLAYDVDEEPNI